MSNLYPLTATEFDHQVIERDLMAGDVERFGVCRGAVLLDPLLDLAVGGGGPGLDRDAARRMQDFQVVHEFTKLARLLKV